MSINAGKGVDTMTRRSVALCGSVGMVVLALVAGLVCSNRPSPGQNPAVLDRAVTHLIAARAVRHQFSAFSLNHTPSFIAELPGARDSDLDFNLSGNGVIECSETGCSINVDVVSQVTGTTRSTKVVGGQVTAILTVEVEVEGQGAFGCTSTDVLPVNGTQRLSCQDAQAGPVIARLLAERKAQAEAESEAGGAPVSYSRPVPDPGPETSTEQPESAQDCVEYDFVRAGLFYRASKSFSPASNIPSSAT